MAAGKKDKVAVKAAKTARRQARRAQWTQVWQAFQMQRKEDSGLLPWMIGSIVASTLVFAGVGILIGSLWVFVPFGVIVGVLAAVIIFSRRIQKSVYKRADGQPGAAGWALTNLKGGWKVTQGVAATGHFDVVHLVIGRPGVILVGEGAAHRVKPLLAQQKKRIARVVDSQTPIYDFVIGGNEEEKEVPLAKLQTRLLKLPRNLGTKQVDAIEARLASLTKDGPAMPKGPMPGTAKMRSVGRAAKRR
jgi:hypothetical protein